MTDDYDEYIEDLENHADKMNPRKTLKKKRSGKAGGRDLIVNIRQWASYGLKWLTLPRAFIVALALIPSAISNLNAFMEYIFGFSPFPVGITSILAFVIGIGIIIIGNLGYKRGGVEKRTMEINEQQDPYYYMIWKKLEEMDKRIKKKEE